MGKAHAETDDRRRNRRRAVPVRQVLATTGAGTRAGQDELMERVVERANMLYPSGIKFRRSVQVFMGR